MANLEQTVGNAQVEQNLDNVKELNRIYYQRKELGDVVYDPKKPIYDHKDLYTVAMENLRRLHPKLDGELESSVKRYVKELSLQNMPKLKEWREAYKAKSKTTLGGWLSKGLKYLADAAMLGVAGAWFLYDLTPAGYVMPILAGASMLGSLLSFSKKEKKGWRDYLGLAGDAALTTAYGINPMLPDGIGGPAYVGIVSLAKWAKNGIGYLFGKEKIPLKYDIAKDVIKNIVNTTSAKYGLEEKVNKPLRMAA